MTAAALEQLWQCPAHETALACVLSQEVCHVALHQEAVDWAEGVVERLRSRLGPRRHSWSLASPELLQRAAEVDLSFHRATRLRRCELEVDALSLRLLARQGVPPELWTVHFEAAEGLCLDDSAWSHTPLAERARRVRVAAVQARLRTILAAMD